MLTPKAVLLVVLSCTLAAEPTISNLTGLMKTPRAQHTATLLQDGRVLITGGSFYPPSGFGAAILSSAEIFDPVKGQFEQVANMTTPRSNHTATLLPDGRVLLTGGYGQFGITAALTTAELFDPSTQTFSPTGAMLSPGSFHSAVLMNNGKVFISGYNNAAAGSQVYDPSSGNFSTLTGAAQQSAECGLCAPITLLSDGRVLIPGYGQTYDPTTGRFKTIGGRTQLSPTVTLANGDVLAAGGENFFRLNGAERYDSTLDVFEPVGSLQANRTGHTATAFPDGSALVAGGETDGCVASRCSFVGTTTRVDRYDPQTRTFSSPGDLIVSRGAHTATLLNDGSVLFAGGLAWQGDDKFLGSLATAEIYRPPAPAPEPRIHTTVGKQGAVLHAGSARVCSPTDPASAGDYLEIYWSGRMNGAAVPPQVFLAGKLAEVLYSGPVAGYPDLDQINIRVPVGVASSTTAPLRVKYLGRLSNEVTIGLR